MVPPASDRVPPAPPYSGYCQVRARFAYGALTLSGPPSHAGSAARAASSTAALQPRARLDAPGLGWSPFARRYSGSHCCSPFLRLLRCFSSAGSPPPLRRMPHLPCGGLPHSGVRGSKAARASPRPFAACRALRRLREPQASPVRPYPLARRAPHRCGLSRGLARSRLRALTHALSLESSRLSLFCICLCSARTGIAPMRVLIFRILSMNRRPLSGGKCGGCGARTHDPRLAKPVL